MAQELPASLGKVMARTPVAWRPVDKAAFGLLYGAIMVLSLLMASGSQPAMAFRSAVVLLGSVSAMTLARVLAELIAHSIATGEPMLTRKSARTAWQLCTPMLAVVVVPVALVTAAGWEWLPIAHAIVLSQGFCVAILVILGARVGWVISKDLWHPLLGATGAGSIGVALAALHYAVR